MTTPEPTSVPMPTIVDAVLSTRPRRRGQPLLWAALIGLLAHGFVIVAAYRVGQPIDAWALMLAGKVHHDLSRLGHIVEPEPEPPPLPEPDPPADDPPPLPETPPPDSEPSPPDPEPQLAPRRTNTQRPAPKAKAGRVVASESDAPVDLTDIVVGDGGMYAGGSTASSGTSDKPTNTNTNTPAPAVDPPPAKSPPKKSRARPPRPSAADWDCPWPSAADRLEINEASAIVKVRVDARGRATNVTVTKDPGHGFGAAAIACAKRARFSPALDDAGEPTPATTPPIRIRFTR